MPTLRLPRERCRACGKETSRAGYRYCSNACQHEYEYLEYIKKWKGGKVSGLKNPGIVSSHVKQYLRRKFRDQCCLCGWSKVNPKTGVVPLVADHIDGNWRNNIEENLRLVCPNCDALTPTYAGLNRGNGRAHRALSERAKESRRLMKKLATLAQR